MSGAFDQADIIVFYVPFGSEEEAERVSHLLIQEKYIACANVMQSKSCYMWTERLHKEVEYVAFMKTIETQADALRMRIEELHSYDVACIASWKISVNKSYYNWILSVISS